MAGLFGQAAQTAEGRSGSQISARREGEESGPDSQIPWNEPFCSVLFSCTLLCLGPEREKRRPVPLSPGGLTSPQREDVKDVVGGMSPPPQGWVLQDEGGTEPNEKLIWGESSGGRRDLDRPAQGLEIHPGAGQNTARLLGGSLRLPLSTSGKAE